MLPEVWRPRLTIRIPRYFSSWCTRYLRLECGQLPENRQISKIAEARWIFRIRKCTIRWRGSEVYILFMTFSKVAREYYYFYLETLHMRTDDAPYIWNQFMMNTKFRAKFLQSYGFFDIGPLLVNSVLYIAYWFWCCASHLRLSVLL